MNPLVPLFLIWSIGKRSSNKPMWPSTASPPPPPPPPPPVIVLDPTQPVPTHPAESGTPLQELAKASAKATNVHKRASSLLRKAKGVLHAPAVGPPEPAQMQVTVSDLQRALISRGAKLKKDGLYGPKTAAAWQQLARQKGLSPMITRTGPHSARVPIATYNTLSMPPVP